MSGLLSLMSGGLTGLVGSLGSAVLDFVKTRERNKHELAVMREAGLQAEKEYAAKQAIASRESEAREFEALEDTRQASIRSDRATYWSADAPRPLMWVDVVRGGTRPVLTLFLTIFLMSIYFTTEDAATASLIADTISYLAGTAVSWWFASRQLSKTKV